MGYWEVQVAECLVSGLKDQLELTVNPTIPDAAACKPSMLNVVVESAVSQFIMLSYLLLSTTVKCQSDKTRKNTLDSVGNIFIRSFSGLVIYFFIF